MERDPKFYEKIHKQYNEKTDEQLYDMLVVSYRDSDVLEASKLSIELSFREYMKCTPMVKDVNYYIGGMEYWYNSNKHSIKAIESMKYKMYEIEEENSKLHINNFIWGAIAILFSVLLFGFLFCLFFK